MKFKPLTTGSGQTRDTGQRCPRLTSQSTDTSKQKIKIISDTRDHVTIPLHTDGARHRQLVSPRVISIMHSAICTLHRWRVLTDSRTGYWSRHNPRIECRVVHTSYCHQREGEERVKMFYEREKYSLMMVSTIRPCQTSSSW